MRHSVTLVLLHVLAVLAGCGESSPEPQFTGLSDEQRSMSEKFASQYAPLTSQERLTKDSRRTIVGSECELLLPADWVQTSPSHFMRRDSEIAGEFPYEIKVIEHGSDGGSLEAALDRFTWTAREMIENYQEQHRWRTVIDEHPAVVVQYAHTEESAFPGKKAVTRAFFTVKHDRYDRSRMRTLIISCTAPAAGFDEVSPLFDEVACRAVLFRTGS
jgi:hypothetical protein